MTSSNTSVVQFDSYELDPFHLYDDPEEIEELDPAWSDYADKQFGETDKNRDDMVQKLKVMIKQGNCDKFHLTDVHPVSFLALVHRDNRRHLPFHRSSESVDRGF